MSQTGYVFNADHYCVDCTILWAGTIPETQYVFENGQFPEDFQTDDGQFVTTDLLQYGIIRDSEGNHVHPLWDTDETDYPVHCCNCGEYLDTSWTQDCQNYVVEAFGRYVESFIYPDSGEVGDPDVLDVWAEHADPSNAKDVYEYIRSLDS